MDGANEFQVLWKVYMPLSKPAIATVALFCIVSRWNGFFWAMVLLQDESKIPLQVYLRKVIVELSDDEEFANTLLTAAYSVETVTRGDHRLLDHPDPVHLPVPSEILHRRASCWVG